MCNTVILDMAKTPPLAVILATATLSDLAALSWPWLSRDHPFHPENYNSDSEMPVETWHQAHRWSKE